MALFPFDHHHYGHSLLPFGSAAAFPSFPAHHAPFAAPFHGFPSAELSAPRAAATQPEGWNAWAPWGGATAWPTASTAPTPTPAPSLHSWGAPPAQAEAWGAPPVGTAPASAPANAWGESAPAAPAAAEEPAQSAEVEEAPAEAAEDEGPVRLTYFAGRGLAEATRLLLEEAGVPYEEVNVQSKEGWDELKPTLRYGQLPTLDIDGLRLYQSKAIARYVARKYGFYGHDNAEQTGIDEILEAETDMWRDNPVQALAGMAPSDPEQLAKHVETYTTKLHKYLTVFENMLKTMAELDPEPLYFVGQRFTLADAAVFHDINMLAAFPQFADILQEYPHLQRWHTGIAQRPRIAEYMASERCHPWPPTPEFLQMVKAIFAK